MLAACVYIYRQLIYPGRGFFLAKRGWLVTGEIQSCHLNAAFHSNFLAFMFIVISKTLFDRFVHDWAGLAIRAFFKNQ